MTQITELRKIDPKCITNDSRTPEELEQFLLFCWLCAGKSSVQQAEKLSQFLTEQTRPFEYIGELALWNTLTPLLKQHKLGKYAMLEKGMLAMTENPDCIRWPREKLIKIPGVSWKTASLYRMHAFKEKIACLDTHILRWLRTEGHRNVPKGSPGVWSTYKHWELVFLGECYQRDVHPWEFDLALWNSSNE